MTTHKDSALPFSSLPKADSLTAQVFQIQRFCLHDGPGIRTSVFLQGCPLSCAWCANPECRLPQGEEVKTYTVGELTREVERDLPFYRKSGGGVTLTGGEVMLWVDFALALTKALHEKGISVAIETSAEAEEKDFLRLAEAVDTVLVDMKHHDPKRHIEGTGRAPERIFGNIRQLSLRGIPHLVRIPVIPAYNDALSDAEAFGRLLKGWGITRVQLLPFHQLGEQKYTHHGLPYAYSGVPQLHPEDLTEYRDVLLTYIPDVMIGGSL